METRVHHAVGKVEVLMASFSKLQPQLEELKSASMCPQNTGDSARDLEAALAKLRIEAKESMSEKKGELRHLDEELERLEAEARSRQVSCH